MVCCSFIKLLVISKLLTTSIVNCAVLLIDGNYVGGSAQNSCTETSCVFMSSRQRLHRELPLSAEELEDVFDSLDTAGSGYLTLEAFSSGFSRCPAVGGC